MQTRGRTRTQWRLSVYRSSWELCRAGGFTLGRFVSIPADRLRLAVGESLAGSAVPVFVDPALAQLAAESFADLSRALQAGPVVDPPIAVDDPAGLPALDLSLLDGRLEPRRTAGWLARRGLRLLKALAETQAKAFALVGRTPSGEETALLCLFALGQALRQAVTLAKPSPQSPLAAVAALLLERATAQAAEHPSVDPQALTARCGLRAALLQSHCGFQGSIDALLASPLNTYRASPAAMQAARGILRSEADLRGADEAIDRIAGAILSSPEAMDAAWVEGAAELVREALAEPFLCVPLSGPLGLQLSRAFGDPQLLCELLADRESREALLSALLRATPAAPFKPAIDLLQQIGLARGRRKPGDALPALPHGGAPGQLAVDQARGAYLIAADSAVRKLLQPLEASVQAAQGAAAEREWKLGQRYRFGPGPEPIACAAAQAQEAQLFVDMKDFTRRTLKVKERGMVQFLRTEFYDPIFAEAARLRAGDEETLAVSNALGDALAFRGDIVAVVELALSITAHLERVRARLDEAAPEVLAGPQLEAVREAEAELSRLHEQRRELEARIAPEESESRLQRLARDEGEVREALRKRREALFGGGLEAGIFVSHGAPASVVTIEHAELGKWPLAIAERLNEAARGTARSGAVKELREQWSAGANGLPPAFAVSVGAAGGVRLPAAASARVAAAQAAEDRQGALRVLAAVFKQLQDELVRAGTLSLLESAAELYNEGCALSAAALSAFRAATAQRYRYFDRTLQPAEIDPALGARLAFPPGEQLHLVLACDARTRALALCFRRAGSLQFKGFDAPTEVWELCDPRGAFVQLLARNHLPRWVSS